MRIGWGYETGDLVTLQHCPGGYRLPEGVEPGEQIVLGRHDHGYWQCEKDGKRFTSACPGTVVMVRNSFMNELNHTRRLADAVSALASTILEIINAKLEAATPVHEQRPAGTFLESEGHAISQPRLAHVLTKKDAAEYLKVSVRTIDSWLSRGLIPHIKIGRTVRMTRSDINTFLERRSLVGRRVRHL